MGTIYVMAVNPASANSWGFWY